MFENQTYQEILRGRLEERCKANPRYSLRAFARDLGIGSGRLSGILNEKLGMSEQAARQICARLGFSEPESDYFCALVMANDARSTAKRKVASSKLVQLQSQTVMSLLPLEAFKVISDWHHFALMELTTVEGFRNDKKWIARRLGISRIEAGQAIERLKKLGLLVEKNGRLAQTEANLDTPSGIPSESLRSFHTQVLQRAIEALSFQSVEERDITNLTVAVNSRDLPGFKKMLHDFRHRFNAEAESKTRGRDEVYMLSMQFFRLTQKE